MSGEPATVRARALPAAAGPEAFPADPDFPQLAVAGDPALMLEVFRTHLKPVAGRRYVCRFSGARREARERGGGWALDLDEALADFPVALLERED